MPWPDRLRRPARPQRSSRRTIKARKHRRTYPYYDCAVLPLYEVWNGRSSEWQNAGSGRPYHYLGSARFFTRLGYACGEAMAGLAKHN